MQFNTVTVLTVSLFIHKKRRGGGGGGEGGGRDGLGAYVIILYS